jgi:AAA family ATP:ADP antiporter
MVTLINLLESNDVLVRLNATKSLKVLKDKDIKLRLNDERLNENIFNESLFFKNTLSAIYSLEKTERTKAKKVKKAQYNSYKDEAAQRTSLLNLLKAHLDLSLETIFYLLSEKYKYSDMEVVFEGIRNDTEESRINAIEFLSNILDSELKDELLPILEYHFLSDKDVNLKIDVIPEKRSLNLLLKERGVATKIRVLKLMQFLNMGSTPVLKKLTKHKNLTVRKLAKKILATSSAN